MATSSTGTQDTRVAELRRRTQGAQVAYTTPGDSRPEFIVSAQYGGQPLKNEDVLPLAESLARIEVQLFQMADTGNLAILQGIVGADAFAKQNAQRDSVHIRELTKQFTDIQEGRECFVKTYLRDEKLLRFYVRASHILSQFVEHDDPVGAADFSKWLKTNIERIDTTVDQMWPCYVEAMSKGVLLMAESSVLRRKWQMLESISNHAHDKWGTPRRVKAWHDIVAAIPKKPEKQPGNRVFTTLWLTVFATLSNIATFALAYSYSTPGPGTFKDADFWLLLQGSIMQWFSLLIASSALWDKTTLPRWSWLVPTIFALICSVIAIPLYLLVPTAWSALATTIGSAVQAFMTVQLAFVGE